jgi:hypothetical protein
MAMLTRALRLVQLCKLTAIYTRSLLLIIPALVSAWFGGWPWLLIFLGMGLPLRAQLSQPLVLVESIVSSFLWLAVYVVTEDRRLYFPYTIQLAFQLYALSPARGWASTGLVALFAVIRLVQGASLIVLTVELLITGVALLIPIWYFNSGTAGSTRRLLAGALASLLAFAGLIF